MKKIDIRSNEIIIFYQKNRGMSIAQELLTKINDSDLVIKVMFGVETILMEEAPNAKEKYAKFRHL